MGDQVFRKARSMRLPVLRGVIDRRILVNYRVDPDVLAGILPSPFRPQTIGGFALAGICLIRLSGVGPRWARWLPGLRSENAAHRMAVEWDDRGETRHGVYVPRRDTSSRLNALAGGCLFPGVHHLSRFDVRESAGRFHVAFNHHDGTHVSVDARTAQDGPGDSVFGSVPQATEFFTCGSFGCSPARAPGLYDVLELRTKGFELEPLAIEHVVSSLYDDRRLFPPGSITLDSAFLMREVEHEWHAHEPLRAAGIGRGNRPERATCSGR